jgi:hypothetical protein
LEVGGEERHVGALIGADALDRLALFHPRDV